MGPEENIEDSGLPFLWRFDGSVMEWAEGFA